MYLLFGASQYYATGGFNDFLGAFDEAGDAIQQARQYMSNGFVGCFGDDPDWSDNEYCGDYYNKTIEWWHVFCTETMQIVAKSNVTPHGVD